MAIAALIKVTSNESLKSKAKFSAYMCMHGHIHRCPYNISITQQFLNVAA